MNRRQLLKTVGSGLVLAALPPLLRGNLAYAEDEIAGYAEGVSCNDASASRLNQLNVDWFYTDWGDYCWNGISGLAPALRHMFHLVDVVPDSQLVATAKVSNPNYRRWWMVGGNEPDTEGNTAQQDADLAIAQMNAVLQGDNTARFCFTLGSQLHAPGNPYGNGIWIQKVWKKIPSTLKTKVKAFHTHYYAQQELGATNPAIYNPVPIQNYLDGWNAYLSTQMADAGARNLWVSEIGLDGNSFTLNDKRSITYPLNVVAPACLGRTQFWAWYGFRSLEPWMCLFDPSGTITPLGQNLASVP